MCGWTMVGSAPLPHHPDPSRRPDRHAADPIPDALAALTKIRDADAALWMAQVRTAPDTSGPDRRATSMQSRCAPAPSLGRASRSAPKALQTNRAEAPEAGDY